MNRRKLPGWVALDADELIEIERAHARRSRSSRQRAAGATPRTSPIGVLPVGRPSTRSGFCANSVGDSIGKRARASRPLSSKTRTFIRRSDVRGNGDVGPRAAASASVTAPAAGSTRAGAPRCEAPPRPAASPPAQPATARRGRFRQPAASETVAAHLQTRDDRRGRRGSSTAGAREDLGGDRVAGVGRALHHGRDAGDRVPLQSAVVDGVDQLGRARRAASARAPARSAASADRGHRTAGRRRTAPPGRSRIRRLRRRAGSPTRRRGPRGPRVAAVRDRTRAGDDHHARLIARAGDQRDQRIVDDHRPRLESDAPHDAAHGRGVRSPIDAGNAETDRRRPHVALAERLFHHACRTFSTSSSPEACRFAPPPRASDTTARARPQADTPSSFRPHRCPGRA